MLRFEPEWYIENVFTRVQGSIILGTSAMNYHGISLMDYYLPVLSIERPTLDGYQCANYAWFYYIPTWKDKSYCEPYNGLWLSSPERAIVESILYDHKFDNLGDFYDCLSCYKGASCFDLNKLEEVANHFGVPFQKVMECYNDC